MPLVLVYLPAACLCFFMLIAQADPGDGRVRGDIETAAHVVIGISLLGLLLSLLPVYRRTMGRWWYAVPVVLAATAWIRAALL
ncbi:hypothetical protein ABZ924_17120 [Streptomyces sp. NPDC046876]|uniref:hypothetical protein n=1 Tax=Streptomyces sp. NPDC046876 TaxID=3155616 RepID=UPI00340F0F9D